MPNSYDIDVPTVEIYTFGRAWKGFLHAWAYEYEDYVEISARCFLHQTYTTLTMSGSFKGTLTVNGTPYSFSFSKMPYLAADYRSTYETEYIQIPFDENGTAEINLTVSVTSSGTVFDGYTLNGTLNHTFSNAAAVGNVDMSPSAKTMGDTATLSISEGTGAIIQYVRYTFGGKTTSIKGFYNGNYTYEWTIPDLIALCPNATSGILTISINAYRFGKFVGSNSISREISVYPASEITVQDMIAGEITPIIIARKSATYTSTIRYSLLQQEGTAAVEITDDTYQWDIPTAIAKLMPNTKQEVIYLYCDTYNGTALVGTTSARANISVNTEDIRFLPVIDSVIVKGNIADADEAFRNLILQNVSSLAVSVEAHSEVSEISEYEIDVFGDSISQSDGVFNVVANSFAGVHTVTVRVTDTRGSFAETTQTVEILPYIKPKVIPYSTDDVEYSAPICYRSDREGIASGSGTFMRILAGKICTEILQDGVNINASKLEYRTRKSTEDWPEEYITLLPFQNDPNSISAIIEDAYPDLKASYQTEIRVTDLVGFSHRFFVKISNRKVSFSLLCAAAGAAFGKTAEFPDVVEIASDMTLWVRGKLQVDNAEMIELQSFENDSCWESGYAYGHNPVSGCYYSVELGNKVNIVFNRAIRWNGSRIILNSEALPEEIRPAVPISNLCAADGGLVMATVGTDGFITVDFVWSAESKKEFHWIDGLIAYWKEDI